MRHRGLVLSKLALFTTAAALLAAAGSVPWAVAFWARSVVVVLASERAP